MLESSGMNTRNAADPPEGFKTTELGPLPEEWQVVRLGEVAVLTMGQSPPSSTYNTVGQGLPFLQGKTEFGAMYPAPVKWCSQPQRIAKRGSILISVRAPVGDANVADRVYCIGRGLAAITGADNFDNWFLFYQLIFSKHRLEEKATGSTFKSINKGVLQNFPIPLPPLPEQRAIAHVLRTVQRAKEATERVIAALKELKKSLMKHLFTYGPVPLDAADQVPLKETEIGPMPEHWQVVRLGEVVTLQRGKDLPKKQREQGRIPVIGSNGIVGWHLKAIAKGPGVCVGRSGSVGKVTWVENDYWPLNTVLWVKDFHGNDPRFVFFMLSQFDFKPYVGGVSVPTLNRNLVHPAKTALPPLPEQREIARILQTIDRKIEAEENRKQALDDLFKTLLHNLMTAKIRVPRTMVERFASHEEG